MVTAQTNATYSTGPTKCWGESYSYDHWANLLGTALPSSSYTNCTQENPGPGGAASANNQLSSRCYDAAGNLVLNAPARSLRDAFTPAYSYDAENHLVYAGGVNYTYDGDGNRVMKSNGPIYWYGTGGDVLDETDLHGNLTNEYVFFGGKRIARRDSSGNVFYYLDDQLGTARSIAEVLERTNDGHALLRRRLLPLRRRALVHRLLRLPLQVHRQRTRHRIRPRQFRR